MNQDLQAKARVIIDLLNEGAEEVSITGTDIKAVRKPSPDNLGSNTQGTIQIGTDKLTSRLVLFSVYA